MYISIKRNAEFGTCSAVLAFSAFSQSIIHEYTPGMRVFEATLGIMSH